MSVAVKKYKKLVKELLFAYSELEYVDEVLKDAHADFQNYYKSFCDKHSVPVDQLNKDNAEKLTKVYPPNEQKVNEAGLVHFEKTDEDKKEHKIFQRMYRIVAKKLHPDKFSNQEQTPEIGEKIESFKKATAAYDKKNWSVFLDICEKYDILPTRYEKINSLIKSEIIEIGNTIDKKKLSFSWRLYECEDDEACMEMTIKDFLYQLFKFKLGG